MLVIWSCADSDDPASVAATSNAWFVEVGRDAGLDFHHAAGRRADYRMPEIIGSGGALFDYDGDGDLDVYLINAADGGGANSTNRMYRQEDDARFTDVTDESGLGDPGYGMGSALGDIDNDGDLDLFVSNYGPDALYLNQGNGVFEDFSEVAGTQDDGWSLSACFLDFDLDGALDLYVSRYVHYDPPKACTDSAGNLEFCGPDAYRGLPDLLYRGRGDGSFEDVSATVMGRRPANKGMGVACADFTGDAFPDIYVTNDGEQNQLWIHRGAELAEGEPIYEDRAMVLGAALNFLSKPEASMGLAVGDVDNDLDLDLFMTHLDRETNTLYRNLGRAGFEDFTAAAGLGPAGLPHTGFGTLFFDADLDGDLDLVTANGRVRRGASLIDRQERLQTLVIDATVPEAFHAYAEPDLFFLGDGSGSFELATGSAGPLVSTVAVSRGVAVGDMDRDGDLDVLVTDCGGQPRLYRNQAPRAGHWLSVRAVDPALGRDALGSVVEVRVGEHRQMRPVISTTSYLTSVEPEVHFGLGAAETVDELAVIWNGGGREIFDGVPANRAIRLLKGEGRTP